MLRFTVQLPDLPEAEQQLPEQTETQKIVVIQETAVIPEAPEITVEREAETAVAEQILHQSQEILKHRQQATMKRSVSSTSEITHGRQMQSIILRMRG